MKSIIVSLEDFYLFQNKLKETKIDRFWEEIVQKLPKNLQRDALTNGFLLIEDTEHYKETFVKRYVLKPAGNQQAIDELNKLGEFYVYVR